MDVLIGDYVYELQFRVEAEENSDNPKPSNMNMDIDPEGDEHDGTYEGDDTEANFEDNTDMFMDNDTKSKQGSGSAPVGKELPRGGSKTHTLPRGKPLVTLSQTGPEAEWQAKLVSTGDGTHKGIMDKLKPLPADAYATPIRSSKRNAAVADEKSVEKATKLKAIKNLDAPQIKGNTSNENLNTSFTSFDDASIITNIRSVGVDLGSASGALDFANNIRAIELARIDETGRNKWISDKVSQHGDDDLLDIEGEMDTTALYNICGNIIEGISDDDCEQTYALQHISQKDKLSSSKKNKKKNRSR